MLFGTWDGKFGDSTFKLVQAVMGGWGGEVSLWFFMVQTVPTKHSKKNCLHKLTESNFILQVYLQVAC